MMDAIIICTKGNNLALAEAVNKFAYENPGAIHKELISVVEVDENIDDQGRVIVSLSEPEINKALRVIFTSKPKYILIHLKNSSKNPLHARSLMHLIRTAGYPNVAATGIHHYIKDAPFDWLKRIIQEKT